MSEYKRLTKKADVKVLDCEYSCGSLHLDVVKRLGELEDKIENGTLIELPCKVGGRVCKIMKVAGVERIAEYVVTDFSYGIHGNFIKAHSLQGTARTITFREFCDCWFSTKAEAEKKLKELQEWPLKN